MSFTIDALSEPVVLLRLVQHVDFFDLPSVQRVCKLWWHAVTQRANQAVIAALTVWFTPPSRMLDAMRCYNATMPGTVAVLVAERLGFRGHENMAYDGLEEHRDQSFRATICIPGTDDAEMVSVSALL